MMMMPNFHSRTPTRKKMAPPTIMTISAVPRSGCFITRPTGASTITSGTIRKVGRPTSSSEAPWK